MVLKVRGGNPAFDTFITLRRIIMAIDPVCGMEVDESTAKYVSEHNGEMYYFCAPGCKHTFEDDPESFVGPNRRPYIPMDEIPSE